MNAPLIRKRLLRIVLLGSFWFPVVAGDSPAQPVSALGGAGVSPVSFGHKDGRDARTTQTATLSADARTLDFPNFENVPYVIESGPLDNDSDEYAVVFSHEVHLPGAVWLRLFYDKATLVGDSRVRVTSLLDGDVQELNAAILAQWGDTSAYFNGDRLLLELVAGPGTRGNELNLGRVKMNHPVPPGDDTQTTSLCGPDDRIPSGEEWSGRIFDGACTGTIFTSTSWMLSAGSCDEPNEVLQFHVPPSELNGRACISNNPPAEHQFPVLPGGMSEANGLGDDWWVAEIGQNSEGLKPFQKYKQLRRVAPVPAEPGEPAALYAYGAQGLNCPNHLTQQLSPGNISNLTATYYVYDNDTTTGCYGAGLIVNDLVVGVATIGSPGCVTGNRATRADNPDFAAARALVFDCLTDLDGDGFTGQADLARLLAAYGTATGNAGFDPVSDLNVDGAVGQSDLAALLMAYGDGCFAP